MRTGWKVWRFHVYAGIAFLLAAVLYAAVSRPLVVREREIDGQLAEAVRRLIEEGHGGNLEEIAGRALELEEEIASLERIANDPSRTLRFSPEIRPMLGQPFQLIDFDGRKFFILDNIQTLSRERKVALFSDWRTVFPSYTNQAPNRIWAELTVVDQLFRTVIEAGVQRIDAAELVKPDPAAAGSGTPAERPEVLMNEVALRMRITGNMESIHRLILMLPLTGDDLAELEPKLSAGEKSAFFLSRFILRKSSKENPDEVELEFVASGFLDSETGERGDFRE